MADNVKQQLIDAWRSEADLTPGVVDFLTAEIPEPPDITTPADVDAAIIANGIAAKYILDLFRPFAGLTPVELVLHIGQLNTVLQGAYLSGLEYLAASRAQQDFTIVEPAAGGVFQPGNLRLIAKAKNGNLTQVAVEVAGHAPVALSSDDGLAFYGFARLDEAGAYALTFHALFDDNSAATATVNVTISAVTVPNPDNPAEELEPAPPDGADLSALDAAKAVFDGTVQTAAAAATLSSAAGDAIIAAAQKVAAAGKAVLGQIGQAAAVTTSKLQQAAAALAAALSGRGIRGDLDPAPVLRLGELVAAVESFQAAVVATYWKNNQHPTGGYTTCPEALQGAAQAMNDKYGPGTVSW